MKWGIVLGFSFVMALMFLYEWPKINQNQKKEKMAYLCLMVMGWILAFILLFFPNTPGPTDLVELIYKPLGKMLE